MNTELIARYRDCVLSAKQRIEGSRAWVSRKSTPAAESTPGDMAPYPGEHERARKEFLYAFFAAVAFGWFLEALLFLLP